MPAKPKNLPTRSTLEELLALIDALSPGERRRLRVAMVVHYDRQGETASGSFSEPHRLRR